MSMEENKVLVRRLLEDALTEARSNPAVLHNYFADNFVDHVRIHHEKSGVHGVKDAMTEVHDAAEGFRMKVLPDSRGRRLGGGPLAGRRDAQPVLDSTAN